MRVTEIMNANVAAVNVCATVDEIEKVLLLVRAAPQLQLRFAVLSGLS
jgi:hypothetical protein